MFCSQVGQENIHASPIRTHREINFNDSLAPLECFIFLSGRTMKGNHSCLISINFLVAISLSELIFCCAHVAIRHVQSSVKQCSHEQERIPKIESPRIFGNSQVYFFLTPVFFFSCDMFLGDTDVDFCGADMNIEALNVVVIQSYALTLQTNNAIRNNTCESRPCNDCGTTSTCLRWA